MRGFQLQQEHVGRTRNCLFTHLWALQTQLRDGCRGGGDQCLLALTLQVRSGQVTLTVTQAYTPDAVRGESSPTCGGQGSITLTSALPCCQSTMTTRALRQSASHRSRFQYQRWLDSDSRPACMHRQRVPRATIRAWRDERARAWARQVHALCTPAFLHESSHLCQPKPEAAPTLVCAWQRDEMFGPGRK